MAESPEILSFTIGADAVPIRLVRVPSTAERFPDTETFRMGSRGGEENEQPIREVRLSTFYMGETPVTQAQYRALRGEALSHFPGAENRPVENVNWFEAAEACKKLEALCRHQTDWPGSEWMFELPSEAQWEYAARGVGETDYGSGDGLGALLWSGWFEENAEQTTHPVGQLAATEGLLDLHGNVWEWCRDVYDMEALAYLLDGGLDPVVLTAGLGHDAERYRKALIGDDYLKYRYGDNLEKLGEENRPRVLRGGSWNNSAPYGRSAIRNRFLPVERGRFDGFRVCLVPRPLDQPENGTRKLEAPPEPSAGGGEGGKRGIELERGWFPKGLRKLFKKED